MGKTGAGSQLACYSKFPILSARMLDYRSNYNGSMVTTHGGGTSRKRMHACADYTGAEIMRVLRDEVVNRGIPVLEFAPAIELLLDDEGKCAGAVLLDYDSNEYKVVRAKTVIIDRGSRP